MALTACEKLTQNDAQTILHDVTLTDSSQNPPMCKYDTPEVGADQILLFQLDAAQRAAAMGQSTSASADQYMDWLAQPDPHGGFVKSLTGYPSRAVESLPEGTSSPDVTFVQNITVSWIDGDGVWQLVASAPAGSDTVPVTVFEQVALAVAHR